MSLFYIQIQKVVLESNDMTTINFNIDQLCKDSGNKTPEEILIPISNGQDPRRTSLVYRKLIEIEEEYGENPPDEWDWLELMELIKSECRYGIVPIKEAASAAKTLIEYKYPKRKAIEQTTITPQKEEKQLTKEEIKVLRKEFDLDY